MKKILGIAAATLVIGTSLALASAPASAHDGVNWSIAVGVPTYAPPVVVYSPPPVVYAQPWRVYREAPAPVVVRYDAPYPYYGYHAHYYHHRHGYYD